MRISDWSSDVCSSDLTPPNYRRRSAQGPRHADAERRPRCQADGRYRHPCCDERRIVSPQICGPAGVAFAAIAQGYGAAPCPASICTPRSGVPGSTSRLSPWPMESGRSASYDQCERAEEHTSETPSQMRISYAVFCLQKKHNTSEEQTL